MAEVKIIVMGKGGVGKSCLTQQFVNGMFVGASYNATIEDKFTKNLGKLDYTLGWCREDRHTARTQSSLSASINCSTPAALVVTCLSHCCTPCFFPFSFSHSSLLFIGSLLFSRG